MRPAKRTKRKESGEPKPHLASLAAILIFLALFSAGWLDHLNFKQQKVYYLPWPASAPPNQATDSQSKALFSLPEFLRQQLVQFGLSPETITEEKTDEGLAYVSARTTARDYRRLKNDLLSALKKKRIKTVVKEEKTGGGELVATFELRQNSRTRGWLVLRYPLPVQARKPAGIESAPAAVSSQKSADRVVAVVIDDLGEDLGFLRELIGLNVPLTVAILPDSGLARESAELAEKNGLEVIIHLPLEAFNNHVSTGGAEGLITTSMSPQDVRSILERDLSLLPRARGLNNHMGSKATSSEALMEIIISFLREKNLYFLDSKTSPRSVAYELALKKKVPAAVRQVFLDADEDRSRIKDRLMELFHLARKNGQAIGIGHPFPETLEALKAYLPRAAEFGVQLAPVSVLVKN
ncbi:MAG: divergent polysaccharide deacetylase family protein [Candidatus Saccharicenans sp.]|nr:divergent polysaccharide deacetylase family protein [Candidatus Saccharicenans sp.]